MHSYFEPLHVSRTATIELHAPVEIVFPLFEPEGEKRWEPSWNPTWIYPLTGVARQGMVFRTAHEHHAVVWTVTEYQPTPGLIAYWRVAPDSHTARIEVTCNAVSATVTTATVTYTFTALSMAGNTYIAQFTDTHFGAWIQSWGTAINAYLAGEVLP